MDKKNRQISDKINIALVASNECKKKLLRWSQKNKKILEGNIIYATCYTGKILNKSIGLDINLVLDGLIGGYQQIGLKIAGREIDVLFFFWESKNVVANDPDMHALIRLATAYNIPLACNLSTANYIIRSALFNKKYFTTHRLINPQDELL